MSNPEPTSAGTSRPESLSDLFSDIFRLANELSSLITQDAVEWRLQRVLKRAGYQPGNADDSAMLFAFDRTPAPHPCAAHGCEALPQPLEARLVDAEQSIADMRRELTAMTEEAQRLLHLAGAARAQAEAARADAMTDYAAAARVMTEAREYHDAALERAASIVREARAAAENLTRSAREAAAHWDDHDDPELLQFASGHPGWR